MMYVSERRADSICDTWLAFLVMKSSYFCSHLGGRAQRLVVLWEEEEEELPSDRVPFVWGISAGVAMQRERRGSSRRSRKGEQST